MTIKTVSLTALGFSLLFCSITLSLSADASPRSHSNEITADNASNVREFFGFVAPNLEGNGGSMQTRPIAPDTIAPRHNDPVHPDFGPIMD